MTGIVIAGVAHSHVDYALAEIGARDELHLLGVHDTDAESAARVADATGAPAFDSLDDLLALKPSIVACAGVYSERADIVTAALDAGADALCDKPLCISLEELDRIDSAMQRTGRHVALMLEKRTYPETIALSDALRDGSLGRPVAFASWAPHKLLRDQRAAWFLDPVSYGGILSDLLVHDIDIALQITGAEHGTVRGWLGPAIDTGFHLQGGATVVFGDETGPRLSAEVDWLTPAGSAIHGDYRMRVVGTAGTAELYWGRGEIELTTTEQPRQTHRDGVGRRPAEDALDALLAGGEAAALAAREALLVSRIALLAEQSARSGGIELDWRA